VYDVTNRKSFENVQKWIQTVSEINGKDIHVALVANKVDLERCVEREAGETCAREIGAEYFETSCRDGQNIDQIFQHVLRGNLPPTPRLLPLDDKTPQPLMVQFSSKDDGNVMSNELSGWMQMLLCVTCRHWRAVDAEAIKPLTAPGEVDAGQRME
jgi:Ras-related protein Rab-6A